MKKPSDPPAPERCAECSLDVAAFRTVGPDGRVFCTWACSERARLATVAHG